MKLETRCCGIRNEISTGVGGNAEAKQTVAAFMDRYLDAAELKASSLRSYESVSRCHIVRLMGKMAIGDIRPPAIQKMLAEMEAEGVGDRTRQLAHAVLRAALAQAVKWEIIPRNPAEGVTSPKVAKSERTVWSPKQVAKFLKETGSDRLHAMYVLALRTGMRQGELFALHWADVDLDGATLRVRFSLDLRTMKRETPETTRAGA